MSRIVRLKAFFCIALFVFCSSSIASRHSTSLKKCDTPRKKYSLVFERNFVTLIDNIANKKIGYPIKQNAKTSFKKIRKYSFHKKARTDHLTYAIFLKETNQKNSDWSGHLTISIVFSDNKVHFFFPLSCLNKKHLKSQIFIS